MKKTEKLLSIEDAAKLVSNGSRIALGGFGIYQRPMAFVRELIKQKVKSLTIVGVVSSIEADILIASNCIDTIETSYVGFEKYGIAPHFRKHSEKGNLKVIDYPELLSVDRFRASQENLDFWPATGLGGTDIVKLNKDIKSFKSPISKNILHALPAAKPDVVVIHALAGDLYGNIIVPSYKNMAQSLDIILSRSCDNVIITIEKIVSDNFMRKHPHLIEIPSHRVKAVCLAPYGAHPTSMLGRYSDDEKHWLEYIKASKNNENFKKYIKKYITSANGNNGYLNKIGGAHLSSLLQVDVQK